MSLRSQMKLGPVYDIKKFPTKLGPITREFPGLERIADLHQPLVVTVKPGDCKIAKKNSHTECAMAQALHRMGADAAIVRKTRTYVIVDKGRLLVRCQTRSSVSKEMTSFDRGAGFDEGTYALSAMNPAHRLGPKRKILKHASRGDGSKRMQIIGRHRTRKMRD